MRNFAGAKYRLTPIKGSNIIRRPTPLTFHLLHMKPLLSRVESKKVDKAAAMLKVLAHPKRLAIVDLLGKEDKMTVTEIYRSLDLPQAIASQHLITLKDRGILSSFKVGTKIYYSLSIPKLLDVIDSLEDCCDAL